MNTLTRRQLFRFTKGKKHRGGCFWGSRPWFGSYFFILARLSQFFDIFGQMEAFKADLEKVVNRPQAENSELYNVLKIAWFAPKDEWKYVYQNVGVAQLNPQVLSPYPQSIALHPPFSILLPQIFFIQPQFSIFNSSFAILSIEYGIFGSKSPQNSMISDKMSGSTAYIACSFFQVCAPRVTELRSDF